MDAVKATTTQPHQVVSPGLSIPKAWALRLIGGALALLLGAGTHALATEDAGLETSVAGLHGRVDEVSKEVDQMRESDDETRARLAKLEAHATRVDRDLETHERLMVAALEVIVVGLRHISEGQAVLETRAGGRARPMPEALERGLNELQLDIHTLNRKSR